MLAKLQRNVVLIDVLAEVNQKRPHTQYLDLTHDGLFFKTFFRTKNLFNILTFAITNNVRNQCSAGFSLFKWMLKHSSVRAGPHTHYNVCSMQHITCFNINIC